MLGLRLGEEKNKGLGQQKKKLGGEGGEGGGGGKTYEEGEQEMFAASHTL